jgi:hypothetical protein
MFSWFFGYYNQNTSKCFTVSPTLISTSVVETQTPSITPTITPTPIPYSIAISEVMANPKDTLVPSADEYIELYNYGNSSIDMGGWYFSLSGVNNQPDEIVSWGTGDINSPGKDLITNSTILKLGQYGVIFPSNYYVFGKLPYSFPKETVIFTMKDGTYLVDEDMGIQIHSGVYLFISTDYGKTIYHLISTYEMQIIGISTSNQTKTNIYFEPDVNISVQRKDPSIGDIKDN